jgi:hypothetical protein
MFCLFGWNNENKYKRGVFGNFIKCYTWQRVPLPSAVAKALDKEGTPGTTALGREAPFAECKDGNG